MKQYTTVLAWSPREQGAPLAWLGEYHFGVNPLPRQGETIDDDRFPCLLVVESVVHEFEHPEAVHARMFEPRHVVTLFVRRGDVRK